MTIEVSLQGSRYQAIEKYLISKFTQLFLRISTPLADLIVRWLSDFSGLLKYLKPV